MGARSVFLTQYVCFNSINIFHSTSLRDVRGIPTPCRSADLVVSSFAINWFNDAINIFRKFMQKTFWLRNVNLVLKL